MMILSLRNLKIFMLSMIFYSSFAQARPHPNVAPDSKMFDHPTAYQTMDDAAIVALRIAVSKSSQFEYGGCIYTDGTQFFFTEPVSEGSRNEFQAACLISPTSLVGLYHTHPLGSLQNGKVSGIDIEVARELLKISYVAILDQTKIVKFVPGKTKTSCIENSVVICPADSKLSEGDFVQSL